MNEPPPLHPIEREHLQREHRLVITVKAPDEFHDGGRRSSTKLERDASVDPTPTSSFSSFDDLLNTLTPSVLDLIEAVRNEEPGSINETARVVGRDVKNARAELTNLAQLGIIYFEAKGRSKRPIVWFDELIIQFPSNPDLSETTPIS